MPLITVANLADVLRGNHLLEPARLDELTNQLQGQFPDIGTLARELMRRHWLTPYRVNRVMQDRAQDLLLGSYVLLDRLGEGGMGQVFKARNWKLGQIVALKLVRKERLANTDAVRRFHREIRAAAQLNHPNIVRALDADEVDGAHLLVMEYVEGTDLAKLVKQRGPLPAADACDYIRQASLGLQHAFEHGMVHRDIKPANLLLSVVSGPSSVVGEQPPQSTDNRQRTTIKILDMGLARLGNPWETSDTTSTMTKTGIVMGTPDYIAPEQARDSHTADIRADLYSLGCTLYVLLTGRAPFRGGTITEKLLRHQLEEPAPVEQRRPEVSPELAVLLRRLMAKRPEDRFQTPADLASALAQVNLSAPPLATFAELAAPTVPPTAATTALFAGIIPDETPVASSSTDRLSRQAKRQRWVRLNAIGGGLLAALLVLFVVLLAARHSAATARRTEREYAFPEPIASGERKPKDQTAEEKKAEAEFKQWLATARKMPANEQVAAVEAKLKELNPGYTGGLKWNIADGKVLALNIESDLIADLRPLQALTELRSLAHIGNIDGKNKLVSLKPLEGMRLTSLLLNSHLGLRDLTPLEGMPLTYLEVSFTSVADLSALRAMPLKSLNLHNCSVRTLSALEGLKLESLTFGGWNSPLDDLTPLKGMRLTALAWYNCAVEDLKPLEGMPLQNLNLWDSKVKDLRPLAGMPLNTLNISSTPVTDLSPLKGMPLSSLDFNGTKVTDLSPLKQIKTLVQINGQPAVEFWKKAAATRSK
jgi:serine/threonine-protein kinase